VKYQLNISLLLYFFCAFFHAAIEGKALPIFGTLFKESDDGIDLVKKKLTNVELTAI